MSRKQRAALTISAFLLFGCMSVAALAGMQPGNRADAENGAPPSLQAALGIRALQPTPAQLAQKFHHADTHDRSMQELSIIDGAWRLAVGYEMTSDGWAFSAYSATRLAAGERSAPAAFAHGAPAAPLQGGSTNLLPGGGSLPPSPGDYPDPPTPDNPDATGQHKIDQSCPYPGTNYDVKVEWVWIPTHVDGDGNIIPGHWQKVEYLIYSRAFGSGGPFCD